MLERLTEEQELQRLGLLQQSNFARLLDILAKAHSVAVLQSTLRLVVSVAAQRTTFVDASKAFHAFSFPFSF